MSEHPGETLVDEWRNLRDYERELADLYRDLRDAERADDKEAEREAKEQITICKEVIEAQKQKIAELQARGRRA